MDFDNPFPAQQQQHQQGGMYTPQPAAGRAAQRGPPPGVQIHDPMSPQAMSAQQPNNNNNNNNFGGQAGQHGSGGRGNAARVQSPSSNNSVGRIELGSMASSLGADPQMAAAMTMGMGVGEKLLETGISRAHQGLSRYVSVGGVKYYFGVDNQYVVGKLRLLLWPFMTKHWERSGKGGDYNNENVVFKSPREDLFAPDLYIPSMAMCTYVLLVCLVLGLGNQFTPETLGMTASSCLALLTVEIGLVALTGYLLDISGLPFLDLCAYCSYTLVGVDLSMVLGIVGGTYAYWAALCYCAAASAFFILKTLRPAVMNSTRQHANEAALAQKRQRQYVLVGCALLQLPVALFLGVAPIYVPEKVLAN